MFAKIAQRQTFGTFNTLITSVLYMATADIHSATSFLRKLMQNAGVENTYKRWDKSQEVFEEMIGDLAFPL